jgi:hypothetical protein
VVVDGDSRNTASNGGKQISGGLVLKPYGYSRRHENDEEYSIL